jgi:hypothetical protein
MSDEPVNPEMIEPLQPQVGKGPDEILPVEEGDTYTYTDPIPDSGVNTALVEPHSDYRRRGDAGTPPI